MMGKMGKRNRWRAISQWNAYYMCPKFFFYLCHYYMIERFSLSDGANLSSKEEVFLEF